MVLAGQGLPANSGTGYELLDGLSGFGTTSQMFDAAYWRAKEGEIARTILANPLIRAARVHIAQAPTKAFQPEQKAKASVTVSTAAGGLLGLLLWFTPRPGALGRQARTALIICAVLGTLLYLSVWGIE